MQKTWGSRGTFLMPRNHRTGRKNSLSELHLAPEGPSPDSEDGSLFVVPLPYDRADEIIQEWSLLNAQQAVEDETVGGHSHPNLAAHPKQPRTKNDPTCAGCCWAAQEGAS